MNNAPKFNTEKFNAYFLENIFIPVLSQSKRDIFENTLDPFSAKIEILLNKIEPEIWANQERIRKNQKTLQNKIGEFHQSVVGFFDGWNNLGQGQIADVINHERKIVAEIKNKFNTTKGNHKKTIYDDLKLLIEDKYIGYSSYCVEILPKKQASYNKPFTPSDNQTGLRREVNENIRVIDGFSWYELISGDKNFIVELYEEHLINAIIYSDIKTNNLYFEGPISKDLINNDLLSLFLKKAYLLD